MTRSSAARGQSRTRPRCAGGGGGWDLGSTQHEAIDQEDRRTHHRRAPVEAHMPALEHPQRRAARLSTRTPSRAYPSALRSPPSTHRRGPAPTGPCVRGRSDGRVTRRGSSASGASLRGRERPDERLRQQTYPAHHSRRRRCGGHALTCTEVSVVAAGCGWRRRGAISEFSYTKLHRRRVAVEAQMAALEHPQHRAARLISMQAELRRERDRLPLYLPN